MIKLTEHPLKLSKIEWRVMLGAIQSQTMFGIKDFLPSLGKPTQNAIKRLCDRGYITAYHPQPGWTIVRLTKKNIKKYNKDLSDEKIERKEKA